MKRLIYIFLLFANISNSQRLDNEDTFALQLKGSQFKPGILLTLGTGVSLYKPAFFISPGLIGDLFEHINAGAGIDMYFKDSRHEEEEFNYILNFLLYYSLKIGKVTHFRTGAGISYYKEESAFSPVISFKFDFEIFNKNYLGAEFKSIIPIPPPVESLHAPRLFLILLNYSIRF